MVVEVDSRMIAEELKRNGDFCFNKGRILAAIEYYTEAISLCPKVGSYWIKRAECYLRQRNWSYVKRDCKKAIELDGSNSKACYLLGFSLKKEGKYSEAIRELQKASEFEKISNSGTLLMEEISNALRDAKYKQWAEEANRELWDLNELKEACEKSLAEEFLESELHAGFDYYEEAATSHVKRLRKLDEIFEKVKKTYVPNEVPDYLCCKISLDIYRDPVIAPSGITYDRKDILKHLEEVGEFDPITREPLNCTQLVPNLAIKEAVQTFLDTHGWAYRLS